MVDFKGFKCTHCSVCCRNITKGEKKVTKDEVGIFYTMDQRSRTVSLWRWEMDRLKQRADELGIPVTLRPLSFIVDTRNSRAIITLYYIDHEACPFLVDERCKVWSDRPFTCKIFPVYGHRAGIGLSSLCPDLVRPPLGDDEVENGKVLMDIYPEETVYLSKDLEIYKMIFSFVRDLENNEVITMDADADEGLAEELISSAKTRIDLFDLVLVEGIMSKEQVQGIFKELDSVEGLKGRLELKVSRDMVGI